MGQSSMLNFDILRLIGLELSYICLKHSYICSDVTAKQIKMYFGMEKMGLEVKLVKLV